MCQYNPNCINGCVQCISQDVDYNNYELFKKYAHLKDHEIISEYLKQLELRHKFHKERLETINIEWNASMAIEDKNFFDFLEKYRPTISKAKVDKLKVFL